MGLYEMDGMLSRPKSKLDKEITVRLIKILSSSLKITFLRLVHQLDISRDI